MPVKVTSEPIFDLRVEQGRGVLSVGGESVALPLNLARKVRRTLTRVEWTRGEPLSKVIRVRHFQRPGLGLLEPDVYDHRFYLRTDAGRVRMGLWQCERVTRLLVLNGFVDNLDLTIEYHDDPFDHQYAVWVGDDLAPQFGRILRTWEDIGYCRPHGGLVTVCVSHIERLRVPHEIAHRALACASPIDGALVCLAWHAQTKDEKEFHRVFKGVRGDYHELRARSS